MSKCLFRKELLPANAEVSSNYTDLYFRRWVLDSFSLVSVTSFKINFTETTKNDLCFTLHSNQRSATNL